MMKMQFKLTKVCPVQCCSLKGSATGGPWCPVRSTDLILCHFSIRIQGHSVVACSGGGNNITPCTVVDYTTSLQIVSIKKNMIYARLYKKLRYILRQFLYNSLMEAVLIQLAVLKAKALFITTGWQGDCWVKVTEPDKPFWSNVALADLALI